MTTLYSNDFVAGLGTGWTVGDTWDNTTQPGWEHAPGSAGGSTLLKRSIVGATYAETLFYGGATSGDNWGVIKLRCTGPSAVYDGDGLGVLMRSWNFNGHQMEIFVVGTPTLTPNPGNVTSLPFPQAPGSAIKVGVHSPSNTECYIYANGTKVLSAVGCTAQTGNNLMLGSYSGVNAFYDYITVTDSDPFGGSTAQVPNIPLRRRHR